MIFGVLGILASASYAGGGPFAYARLGLADPIFFVMFGVVAVAGTYYVQAAGFHLDAAASYFIPQALPWTCLVLGMPVGALVTNVLLIDDIRDRAPDGAKGWHTGSVRFGVNWTRGEIVGTPTSSPMRSRFGSGLGSGFSPAILLPLLTLPRAASIARTVCVSDGFAELFPMTPKASFLSLYYGALLAIGIAI